MSRAGRRSAGPIGKEEQSQTLRFLARLARLILRIEVCMCVLEMQVPEIRRL